MGLHKPCSRFLGVEHRSRPIRGRVFTLGRKTLRVSANDAAAILRSERREVQSPGVEEGRQGTGQFDDSAFLAMLGVHRVDSIEISDYEDATIVHDLGDATPSSLEGQFDFSYDGRTLDNVFGPVTGVRNVSRPLRHGGRVVRIEHASNDTNSAYPQSSPSWFSGYCTVNRLADV